MPGANGLDFLAGYPGLTDQQKAAAKSTAGGQLTAAHDALTAAIQANKADIDLEKLAATAGIIGTTGQKAKYDAFQTRTGPGPGGPGKH